MQQAALRPKTQSVPFFAISNPLINGKLGSLVHLFTYGALAGPPSNRPARMSLCSRFSVAPEAFTEQAAITRWERGEDTCPKCWNYLQQYLSKS
jgi:hypothetical protein